MNITIKNLCEYSYSHHCEIVYGLYVDSTLSASGKNIEMLYVYLHYIFLITKNTELKEDIKEYNLLCCRKYQKSLEYFYDKYKIELREVWCPKINHEITSYRNTICTCPLYD